MACDESISGSEKTVIAYHATSRERMANILKTRTFQISRKHADWLGDGVYFWEGTYRADEWAHEHFPAEPAVIQARIKLGECLDLCDAPGYRDDVRQAFQCVEQSYPKLGRQPPVNDLRKKYHALDRTVFNYLHNEIWSFDTIRCPFPEGPPIYPGTVITTQQHIQLCVKNLSCILEIAEFKRGVA